MKLRILHVEDDAPDSELIRETLINAGVEPEIVRVDTAEALRAALKQGGFDIILSDFNLPMLDGLTALEMARKETPDLPFVMVTGSLGDESAVDVIKRGAWDFVVKENLRRLVEAVLRVRREAEERRVRRAAEQRQRLLMRELDHRVKNNLASVIALCEQMLRDARSLEEFGAAFTGRLHNMARLQEALANSNWQGATIRDLITLTVGPFVPEGPGRFRHSVPERLLPASVASTLSMIFYELASNAARHGAFGSPEGRVEITWQEQDGKARLNWTEHAPGRGDRNRPGRGMALIEGFTRHELGGTVDFEFRPTGIAVSLAFPLPDPDAPKVAVQPVGQT